MTSQQRMHDRRRFGLLCAGAAASVASAQVQEPDASPKRQSDITVSVNVVTAPTTVRDKDGNYISDLKIRDFLLTDNDKEQILTGELSFNPISMVVAVQANNMMDGVIPRVQKITPLLEQLILGDRGEAAILSFDHRLQTLQDFTNDTTLLDKGLQKLRAGSSSSRMVDAVGQSIRMLRGRPKDHRRVVLLISETRNVGGEGKLSQVLTDAEFGEVTVYTVNIARLLSTFTSQMRIPRPSPIPTSARHMPAGGAPVPTTVDQLYGGEGHTANFVPLLGEIFRGAKGLFVDNPSEVLTKYTGGREFNFTTERGLEQSLSELGQELHSQYVLAYQPNNSAEAGYHEIRVLVRRPNLEVRTRPGYWWAGR